MLSSYLWETTNIFSSIFNESEIGISVGVLVTILVGGFFLWILFLYLGYRLIKYGVYHDSLLAIIVGVLLTEFWIGLIIVYFLTKKRDREMATKKKKESELSVAEKKIEKLEKKITQLEDEPSSSKS